jgi:hypothetical protein
MGQKLGSFLADEKGVSAKVLAAEVAGCYRRADELQNVPDIASHP